MPAPQLTLPLPAPPASFRQPSRHIIFRHKKSRRTKGTEPLSSGGHPPFPSYMKFQLPKKGRNTPRLIHAIITGHRTAPHRTAPHRTAPQKFIRLPYSCQARYMDFFQQSVPWISSSNYITHCIEKRDHPRRIQRQCITSRAENKPEHNKALLPYVFSPKISA